MYLRLILTFFLGLFFQNLVAAVTLPVVIGDDMVLKQKSNPKLWGIAHPNTVVEVVTSWDREKYTVQANENGEFSLRVSTGNAGGPYTISFINAGDTTTVNNILLGEVWFCSGQSNMEMPLKGFRNEPVLNADKIIESAANDKIRIFKTVKAVNFEEQKEAGGKWEISSPAVAENTSAVAWQFAQMLQEELGVPVGIIISAWGGTPIKSWMSRESLQNFTAISLTKPDTVTSKTPAGLFNGMVAPIAPFTVSGFLWYQGENDHTNAEGYSKMMPAMVEDWRHRFENEKLPFYFVQIAPWKYNKNSDAAAYFREMQYELSKSIAYSGIAVTTDAGSDKTIHPANKTIIAERLVRIAMAKDYGRKSAYLGPELKTFKVKGNKAVLSFSNGKGLRITEDGNANFKIAGQDRVFHAAQARVKNGKVEVWADEVQKPVAVRYAFDNYVDGNLFNGNGLPASTFRTDNW